MTFGGMLEKHISRPSTIYIKVGDGVFYTMRTHPNNVVDVFKDDRYKIKMGSVWRRGSLEVIKNHDYKERQWKL